MQLQLFGELEVIEEAKQQREETNGYDLQQWALVYLVYRSGGYGGNLFILSVDDARKLCSDKCSRGFSRGGEWQFHWTTIDHFTSQNKTYDGRLERFVFIPDSGKQDRDFERLGIKKPTLEEMDDILRSRGYALVFLKNGKAAKNGKTGMNASDFD